MFARREQNSLPSEGFLIPGPTCNHGDSPQWVLQFIEVIISGINRMAFFSLSKLVFFYLGEILIRQKPKAVVFVGTGSATK